MVISGCDVAASTGLSWIIGGKPERCLAIKAEGEQQEEMAADLADALRTLWTKQRPDFVAIEQPLRKIDHAAGILQSLAAAAVVTCRMMDLPWGTIAIATWRVAYYGSKVRPTGDEDWKDLALRYAGMQKIILPDTKAAARDAAEAVGIGVAWRKCNFVPARHRKTFMDLQSSR